MMGTKIRTVVVLGEVKAIRTARDVREFSEVVVISDILELWKHRCMSFSKLSTFRLCFLSCKSILYQKNKTALTLKYS